MHYDLLIVVPLEEEFKQVLAAFPYLDNLTSGTQVLYRVSVPNGLTALVALQEKQGFIEASAACSTASIGNTFGIFVCLGIAGSLATDAKLGDVCYSNLIIDTFDNNKIVEEESGKPTIELAPEFHPVPKQIYGPLSFPRVMPELSLQYEGWRAARLKAAQQEFGLSDQVIPSGPDTHGGALVSGFVAASTTYAKMLKRLQRKALAVETEAAAVHRAAEQCGTEALTIRGISDLADEEKAQLEHDHKGGLRAYAAGNAATFLKMQLENPYFFRMLLARRPTEGTQLELVTPEFQPNLLAVTQDKLLTQIDLKLRELNPAYRVKPKGYQLPLPRLKPLGQGPLATAQAKVGPIEIREAVTRHKRLVIEVPRLFPDRSLAWLIAHDLIYETSQHGQLVPVVISGERVRPPRGTFTRLADVSLEGINEAGGELVFIIDEFLPSSKTGIKQLSDNATAYPNARIVVLLRDEAGPKEVEDLVQALSAEHHSLTEISFSEIAAFITKQFEMPPADAEVVALRLRRVFNRFELPAHPSYFAGIPEEMLSALLSANRRAELIQLAVDGFLTILVASDRAKVRLSRTTRAEFLRAVAREVSVEKRLVTDERLREMAQAFLLHYGFDVTDDEFLVPFFDQGVLIYSDTRLVRFGLPFMQAYLLALELASDPACARTYFDLAQPDFDLLTFDLYAEVGASDAVIEHILSELRLGKSDKADWEKEALLLGNSINPVVLQGSDRVNALQTRLEIATKAIASDQSERNEKQRLLDLAEVVSDQVNERRRESKEDADTDTEASELSKRLKAWAVSVVLLGQGSERLTDDVKRELAQLIVAVGSSLMDDWTREYDTIDFASLKSELLKPERLKQITRDFGELPTSLSPGQVVGTLVDLLEMGFLMEPTRVILQHVCEEAKHIVLMPAIEGVKTEGPLTSLFKAVWAADVRAVQAREPSRAALASLPRAAFLRVSVATHYLVRAYWDQSDRENRLEMLAFANRLLQPIGRSLPMREIQKDLETRPDGVTNDPV